MSVIGKERKYFFFSPQYFLWHGEPREELDFRCSAICVRSLFPFLLLDQVSLFLKKWDARMVIFPTLRNASWWNFLKRKRLHCESLADSDATSRAARNSFFPLVCKRKTAGISMRHVSLGKWHLLENSVLWPRHPLMEAGTPHLQTAAASGSNRVCQQPQNP